MSYLDQDLWCSNCLSFCSYDCEVMGLTSTYKGRQLSLGLSQSGTELDSAPNPLLKFILVLVK